MTLAWGGFLNGRIPQTSLAPAVNFEPLPGEPVGPSGGYLMAEAAHQFAVMDQHFFAETGKHLTLSEGYRNYTSQQARWNSYRAGSGNLAAYPGTSGHGWARSADIGSVGRAWVKVKGFHFGWYGTVPSEDWHFDYIGGATIKTAPSSPSAPAKTEQAILPQKGKTSMYHIRDTSTGAVYVVGPQQVRYVADATAQAVANKVIGPRIELGETEAVRLFHAMGIPTRFLGRNGINLLKENGFWSRGDDLNKNFTTD